MNNKRFIALFAVGAIILVVGLILQWYPDSVIGERREQLKGSLSTEERNKLQGALDSLIQWDMNTFEPLSDITLAIGFILIACAAIYSAISQTKAGNSKITVSTPQQPAPTPAPVGKSYFQKYKKPIIASLAAIVIVILLVSPIIPIQYPVTRTRTRNLLYSAQLYDKIFLGNDLGPYFVNVTNTDSIGGDFSITMNKWLYNPAYPISGPERTLQSTSSQSSYIDARTTHIFYIPSDWYIFAPMYSITYSVSAPSIQENYNVTQTEYKSIISLIFTS